MNNSIKRAQSQARLSFAERENQRSLAGGESNFRPKVRQYKKLMMTLVLLLTVATGAWAADDLNETIATATEGQVTYTSEHFTISGQYADSDGLWITGKNTEMEGSANTVTISSKNGEYITKIEAVVGYCGDWNTELASTSGDVTGTYAQGQTITISSVNATEVTLSSPDASAEMIQFNSWTIYYTTEPPIEVTPVAEPAEGTKQWTFTQPASNVVLTPIYASATIYDADGETEKMAYETLKEAIQNVQSGETIKLDWDVTFTEKDEPIETSLKGNGVTFTLDLNGHTIDGRALDDPCIVLSNDNDQMTITDSSTDQTGGVKGFPATGAAGAIIFDGGRYFLGAGVNAENIKGEWDDYVSEGWQLAGGKEFVDLEGGADANDGFTLRVDYAAFELTIGAGRFATFYDTHNITMIEENQNISFYTIKKGDIDLDNNVAKVTKVENAIIPAGLPLLVYNGGQQQQTVKLKVTTAEATPIPNIAIEFVGTASGREFDDVDMAAYDYYALSGGKMFVPVYETGTIAPHKCWIQFPKQQGGARTITIVFDDATAISTVSGSPADTGDIYDLNGRKIVRGTSSNGTLRKGVYVKEGQKVIIK